MEKLFERLNDVTLTGDAAESFACATKEDADRAEALLTLMQRAIDERQQLLDDLAKLITNGRNDLLFQEMERRGINIDSNGDNGLSETFEYAP